MSKNETFFVRLLSVLIGMTPVYGEITVGLLREIESNAKQSLLHRNILIPCEPFGVVTLEKMILNSASPQECRSEIEHFYKAHPHDKQFAREHLYLQHSYHYEMIKEGCILYGNGAESYSEMLLRQGLAVVDPALNNKEWNGRLHRAQKGAESLKSGLHDTLIRKFCIKEEK
jgi:hypothetical protein